MDRLKRVARGIVAVAATAVICLVVLGAARLLLPMIDRMTQFSSILYSLMWIGSTEAILIALVILLLVILAYGVYVFFIRKEARQ